MRKQIYSHGEWEVSSLGSNASMNSAGTAAASRHHDEQAAIAAKDVEYLHAADQQGLEQDYMEEPEQWQVHIFSSLLLACKLSVLPMLFMEYWQ